MIQFFVPDRVFVVCLYLLLLVVGLLFIVDFRFRKPSNLTLAFLVSGDHGGAGFDAPVHPLSHTYPPGAHDLTDL